MSRGRWRRVSDKLLEYDPAVLRAAAHDTGSEDEYRQERMICRALRRAWEESLTPCQKKYMDSYYREHMTVYEIAAQECVMASTVSRTLSRARCRLRGILKYYI